MFYDRCDGLFVPKLSTNNNIMMRWARKRVKSTEDNLYEIFAQKEITIIKLTMH